MRPTFSWLILYVYKCICKRKAAYFFVAHSVYINAYANGRRPIFSWLILYVYKCICKRKAAYFFVAHSVYTSINAYANGRRANFSWPILCVYIYMHMKTECATHWTTRVTTYTRYMYCCHNSGTDRQDFKFSVLYFKFFKIFKQFSNFNEVHTPWWRSVKDRNMSEYL